MRVFRRRTVTRHRPGSRTINPRREAMNRDATIGCLSRWRRCRRNL
jgi:hypothetical protein